MLFAGKSLGIEINPSGFFCALLRGAHAAPCLERVSGAPLPPGTLHPSLREPNILDPQAFTAAMINSHNLLLHPSRRFSLTLPDAIGRLMLIDFEGRFKNRAEGIDMIKWKLKKSIPFEIADAHLDYQQLAVRENGDMALLVAVASRTVIGQYEDIIDSAGFAPVRIEFATLSQSRMFSRQVEQTDGLQLLLYQDSLGAVAYHDGSMVFVRIKGFAGVPPTERRLFMEIGNSLRVYRERFPERETLKVFCCAPQETMRAMCAMVADIAGVEPSPLDLKSAVTLSGDAPGDHDTLYRYSGAIGAALGGL
jgi:type IV pilus assembly protein PilM